MIELERTYLVKSIPEGLKDCKSKEVIDIYVPLSAFHPVLRIRKNGDNYEITKKQPVKGDDSSEMEEQTIVLTKEEFENLSEVRGKYLRKIRYYYNYHGRTAEVDVFQDKLKGLILVDFEFDNPEDKNNFQKPDFCLEDVTQERLTAGGMLCGKSYEDIEKDLEKFGYKKLIMD